MKTTYKTQWFPAGNIHSSSELVQKALLFHIAMFFPKMIKRRTVKKVKDNYNEERQKMWDRLDRYDWDAYILFPQELQDFVLIHDEVKYSTYREARILLLQKLEKAVASVAKPGGTVVEFGSGDGRNILYLKKKFPDMKFVGLELSDVSVELSKAAAKKFGIDGVEFICANATEDVSRLTNFGNVVCCYSSFALEMMPRIFTGAVKNMLSLSQDLVAFFEPVEELWTKDTRGWASRLRVKNMDRLRGLYDHLKEIEKQGQWKMAKAERPGIAINPFNEMVEIHMRKNKA